MLQLNCEKRRSEKIKNTIEKLNYNKLRKMSQSSDKLQRVEEQLDETQQIMHKNIDGMQKNVAVGEELAKETDALVAHSKDFRDSSKRLKQSMWWKNMKIWLIIGAVALIILIIIIIIIVASLPEEEQQQ